MKVLVTGASGFIGSHLVERCLADGLDVKAFVRYNSNNNWGWLDDSQVLNNVEIITGDIRDYDSVHNAMQGCDSVFHLAALIGIPYSYVSPLAYIKTNIEGTYNVLQSAKKLNFDNVIITSTSETYGSAQYVPIDENHSLIGQSPYSASKIAADQLAVSFHRSFGLPIKIVRPFNTYGPRQSARAIIPTVISQLVNNELELKVGNLHTTRDLTYVMDTVDGFLEVFKVKELIGETINIGMGTEISIKNLIDLISKLMNKKVFLSIDKERIRPDKSEVERLKCDNSKLKKNTNWNPRYDLESGLLETIKWFEMKQNKYKHNIYNI